MAKRRLLSRERKALGRRLKQAREASNLSQSQAAKRIGLPASSLANYEQGRAEIPLAFLPEACQTYRVRIETLLGMPMPEGLDLEIRQHNARVLRETRELLEKVGTLMRKLHRLHHVEGPLPPRDEEHEPDNKRDGGWILNPSRSTSEARSG